MSTRVHSWGSSALVIGAVLVLACHSAAAVGPSEGFGTLTVDEVSALIAQHAASIYDANNHDRYVKSHVPTAKWVDPDEMKAADLPPQKDRTLVFYCANEH